MADFYPAMHAIVGELMNAQNFYIAPTTRSGSSTLLLRGQHRP
jgi:hypothetical protein